MIKLSKLIITGGTSLKGKINVSGSKNAVLPIIAATIITNGNNIIKNVPSLTDVDEMISLMKCFGCSLNYKNNQIDISCDNINNLICPYEIVSKFRASFLVSGPLLAKYGYVRISMPGGCAIGARPVDLHIKGLTLMGATVSYGQEWMELKSEKLQGAKIYLDFPSVGATENLMIAACLADGITEITNAATEPEVADLANYLIKCGANIKGVGTEKIIIEGQKQLSACSYNVIPDRIEAGTYMIAAACTKGNVDVYNVSMEHISSIVAKLKEIGVNVIEKEDCINVSSNGCLYATEIKTLPYPGFPTDMQSAFSAMMCYAQGTSLITETIFENRFMHLSELIRMHANIKIDGRNAVITGKTQLDGACVRATDLRAGAALAVAGLAADGITEISDAHLIYRGYENFCEKLSNLGAIVRKM